MIYFRADMNETIATGHIMRCLSIADAVREAGEESCFIVADENACSLLKERGYEFRVLHSDWRNLDKEIDKMAELITKEGIEVLLVDSYMAGHNYLDSLNKLCNVVYIDDLYKEAYPVSAVINYDACEEKEVYLNRYSHLNTGVYYGYEYVPLRKEYSGLKHAQFNNPREQNILILSGGSDPEHFIKTILRKIDISEYKKVFAVCGRYSEDYVELLKTYMDSERVEVLQNISNLWEYMIKADVCISAAGNTAYELMAAGTPTILYTMSKEQEPAAKTLSKNARIYYAGSLKEAGVYEKIKTGLKDLMKEKTVLQQESERLRAIIDGNGSNRIARLLMDF
ncbi:MAG: UDP-2,4-diacetamido-2,4,6-trideoxy-beta-L-altropyranose hydrolase [Lachnospiraceae bacterium]|nr:UDP-2,4-diacetamido-2,4,6-trideoxy-beta-L-altropyranose hydrolase [Lachnospiraceae bacterium]